MENNLRGITNYLESQRIRLLNELATNEKRSSDERKDLNSFSNKEEVSMDYFEREKNRAFAETVRQKLKDVERALEKIKGGSYGSCDCCGKPIPRERLEAIPETTLCLTCKAKQSKFKTGPALSGISFNMNG